MSRAPRAHLPPASGGPGAPNPLAHFTKVKKLGEGGFGKVFLVRDARDGMQWVMKEVDLSKLDAKGRAEATKECAFLARMAHPNMYVHSTDGSWHWIATVMTHPHGIQ